ncbi:hypothetical protein RDI58_021650 [Solanum bulbocastanum]|uniref:Uncharacterized protein n=1 Tax=Solanum bulbocastanum TaxID=147425 RepID=A0AAN8T958_SOLBU
MYKHGIAFNGIAFFKVIPILSFMSKSSGFTPLAKTQSNLCKTDPKVSGNIRETRGTAGHILRPEPNGINSK